VSDEPSQGAEQVRAAEVIGALCLATDLGMGFPFEHGLHTTLVASRLADRLGVDPATASQAYYACLLSHAGCTTDAHVTAELFGASLTTHLNPVLYGSQREVLTGLIRALPEPESPAPVRAFQAARGLPRIARVQRPHFNAMCEVAQMLADGVGLPSSIAGLLAHLTERWDGKGPLRRAKGEEIPLPMRIVHVPSTPLSSARSAAWSAPRGSPASAPEAGSIRRWPPASPTMPRRSSRSIRWHRLGMRCSRVSQSHA
jgi:hypothetical protein